MTDTRRFDLLNSSLEGTNLIEASAGTGKTFTLAALFLRLILENHLPVNEILVVTFTEAATGELRDRVRSRLREAMTAFSDGRSEDAFLNGLVEKTEDVNSALVFLGEALRSFDQAAIFTIHGFCRRTLQEKAFESGGLFDTELITDPESLKREIVEDFWRLSFYEGSPLFVNYALSKKFNPDALVSLIANRDAQPYLKIIPRVDVPDTSLEEKRFKASFGEIQRAWPSAKAAVEKILTTSGALNRNKYRKANIPLWIQSMDDYVRSGDNNPLLFKGFEKFTSEEVKGAAKKGQPPPAHPFFDQCSALQKSQVELERIFEQCLLGLKAELFPFVRDAFRRKKGEKNIQAFDDLLLNLHGALEGKGGEELLKAIRMKYKAALIDEFQDTDPVQYAIFKRVFGDGSQALFLIGDPKQAIYGFRGADIFTYMEASGDVESRYTLDENWRSDPRLITATNAIFTGMDRPFVFDKIEFQPAVPAATKETESLKIDGQTEPPFELWFLDAGKLAKPGKPIDKTRARELIPGAVAGEISRLILLGREKRAFVGERALEESDIAVLVRRNSEALLMQAALSLLHIPSVLYSSGNLFDAHEALEMERILAGIAAPNNDARLKAALATDIMGVGGEGLDALMRDETGWENWLVRFRRYHDLWKERGFMRMFRDFLLEEKILPRLMVLSDGERRSTNLHHLVEVLHRISVEKKLNMARLLKWLSEQRDVNSPRLEEHQLRLESDESAVKLVTIHKCKGLEYPVVFCPFSWDGSRTRNAKDPFTFHDQNNRMRLTFDLGSPEMKENRRSAEKELLAENMRLLYVALTRAKNRCYLVWGRIREAETSALAYLLYPHDSPEERNIIEATEKNFDGLSNKALFHGLEVVRDKAGHAIRLSEMPSTAGVAHEPLPAEAEALDCRRFSGKIDRLWRISSFSSLVSGHRYSPDTADRDALDLPEDQHQEIPRDGPEEETPAGIFAFPKGAKAGTFMHDIFEHLDFTLTDPSLLQGLVADRLGAYGFDLAWVVTLCDMVQEVLTVQLDPGMKDLRLSHIRNQDRLNELEFYFPLKRISAKKLRDLFAQYGRHNVPEDFPDAIERLDFLPVRGFMKGFIDMVFRFRGRFYLVDWKSNVLGSRVADYDPGAVTRAMKEGFYIFQYHIYTVALNQYLKLRLPDYKYEEHFGGVYYIFLRGVDSDEGPDYGIYRDRPAQDLIEALCKNLISA